MNNLKDIWLNIDDVAVLTGELKETVTKLNILMNTITTSAILIMK